MYQLAPDQLDRFRRAIADDKTGVEIAELVERVHGQGIEISAHDQLKSMPRGYPKDHPRAELLRYKGLITWRQWPVAKWLGTGAAKPRVVEFLRASQPIRDWLAAHVGESTQPVRER
jgi:uncharacterized protein (DUF2461 family)